MYIYIYIYIHTYIHTYIHMYIYIYTERERERWLGYGDFPAMWNHCRFQPPFFSGLVGAKVVVLQIDQLLTSTFWVDELMNSWERLNMSLIPWERYFILICPINIEKRPSLGVDPMIHPHVKTFPHENRHPQVPSCTRCPTQVNNSCERGQDLVKKKFTGNVVSLSAGLCTYYTHTSYMYIYKYIYIYII